jgi:hypothetical protein
MFLSRCEKQIFTPVQKTGNITDLDSLDGTSKSRGLAYAFELLRVLAN